MARVNGPRHSLRLDAAYVESTADRLEARIRARFPDRHLGDVAHRLVETIPTLQRGFDSSYLRFGRTRLLSRTTSAVIVVMVAIALALTLKDAVTGGLRSLADWVPFTESVVNDVVFAGIAVFFLWALPERRERRTLLSMLHELRSLAHVVDMHQLDKDPEQARPDYVPTPKSPPNRMTAEQLRHYLDYCSELVSLIAKTAALCGEHTSDPVVLETIGDLETLAAQMSQKIWQKISLLPSE